LSGRPQVAKRMRLPAEARRAQLLQAAGALVLAQGYLPLALDKLAGEAGVSKALIYSYFPSQHDLFNALVAECFQELAAAGVQEAAAQTELTDAVLALGDLYFTHVAEGGPVAHVILRDLYMARQLAPELARFRDGVIRPLVRRARRELGLTPREAVAAANLLITIPEEAGAIAFSGEMVPERARELSRRLLGSALTSLRPAA
jgi:AcrR family transcriptional regulator